MFQNLVKYSADHIYYSRDGIAGSNAQVPGITIFMKNNNVLDTDKKPRVKCKKCTLKALIKRVE